MKKLILLLLFPLLLGAHCRDSPRDGGAFRTNSGHDYHWASYSFPIPVKIDYSIPSQIRHDIREAADHWGEVVGFSVFEVSEFQPGDPGLLGLPVHGTISVGMTELGRGSRGGEVQGMAEVHLYNGDRGRRGRIHSANVWIDYDADLDTTYDIALHELGHSLGLRHDGDRYSVMFWTIKPNQYIMSDDIDRIQRMAHWWQ